MHRVDVTTGINGRDSLVGVHEAIINPRPSFTVHVKYKSRQWTEHRFNCYCCLGSRELGISDRWPPFSCARVQAIRSYTLKAKHHKYRVCTVICARRYHTNLMSFCLTRAPIPSVHASACVSHACRPDIYLYPVRARRDDNGKVWIEDGDLW